MHVRKANMYSSVSSQLSTHCLHLYPSWSSCGMWWYNLKWQWCFKNTIDIKENLLKYAFKNTLI